MKQPPLILLLFLHPHQTTAKLLPSLPSLSTIRRHLSLSTLLTPTTTLPATSRILSTPAFAVTTHWGSPYMIFERLSRTEVLDGQAADAVFNSVKSLDDEMATLSDTRPDGEDDEEEEERNIRRTTALYFTDPEDATSLVDEMKQMGGGMSSADVRVMSTSLGRAVRQASVLGRGLPTGQPLDQLTGRLRFDRNGMLRYKIVPSRRELFYASRCRGKERVGLFGDTVEDDAKEVLTDAALKMQMRQRNEMLNRGGGGGGGGKKKKGQTEESFVRKQYAFMQGKTGIPLFYVDGLRHRVDGLTKRLTFGKLGKTRDEIPLFFSYEDLMKSWKDMNRKSGGDAAAVPARPPPVEVFNFMDVVVALDKVQWKNMPKTKKSSHGLPNWVKIVTEKKQGDDETNTKESPVDFDALEMEKVVFIPSSRALAFKDRTTAKGNCKARLRPMR